MRIAFRLVSTLWISLNLVLCGVHVWVLGCRHEYSMDVGVAIPTIVRDNRFEQFGVGPLGTIPGTTPEVRCDRKHDAPVAHRANEHFRIPPFPLS
jgi:hypothetical protein